MEEQNGHAVKDEFPSSSKFKWKIEKVSELNQDNRFSPTFTVGPYKWRLLAFHRGSNVDDYLSVYLVAVDCTDTRYTKFSLAVVGQTNNTLKKDTEGRMIHFTKEEDDWGFDEFIRFNELTDPSNGYMVNDAFTVEVELCSFSKPDSIKELVPMELMESGHSGMKFSHEKTEDGKKLAKDNFSANQSRNTNAGLPVSSKSRMDDQSMLTPVSNAVSVTPKPLKESDGCGKYSIDEIKARYHLDERFEVEFVEGEDKLTDKLVKKFPCDKDNLLIAVGQLEAGLRLPLYYPENPFYYEVLSQRADKRGIFQYTGNFFRFLRECRKRSKGCTGITSIVPQFRREDYTATNFNWTWADNISVRNRFPWCVGPRRISYSQDQDFSGKAELLPEYKGKKRFDMVRLDHDEKWFRTPLRIKGPWVMGWLTSGDPRTSFEKYYPPYEPWTLNMVASAEVTSVPHAADGTDTDGDDSAWTTPLVRLKRKPAPGDQTVEDTSLKMSRPDTLDVRSSIKNTEDVKIPNVDDALQIFDTLTPSSDVGLNEKDTVNRAKGYGSISTVDPSAMNTVSLRKGDATRVMEENTAPITPFVNSSGLDSEAGDGFHSTMGSAPPPPLGLADMENLREFDTFRAKFVENCHKLNYYHTKSEDLAIRLSDTQREKDLLASEVCSLKSQMQARADEAGMLAEQIEATNGVQEKLAIANARIQELEKLHQTQALQHADLQLQLEGVQEHLAIANARIQELESVAKEICVKLAESSGMMKPGEKKFGMT